MNKNIFGKNNPMFGKHHSNETKKLLRTKFKGKTYEERYDIKKAREIKKKQSITCKKHCYCWAKGLTKEMDYRLKIHSEKMKGHIPWNKGLTKKNNKIIAFATKKQKITINNHQWKNTIGKEARKKSSLKHMIERKEVSCSNCKKNIKILINAKKKKFYFCNNKCFRTFFKKGKFKWKDIYSSKAIKNLQASRQTKAFKNKRRQYMKYIHNSGNFKRKFKDTKIELKLQQIINKMNIPFKTNYNIIGRPDIFIKPNICIFADGDFYHGYFKNLSKYPRVLKMQINTQKRDKYVNRILKSNNYIILRFWEHDIIQNIEKCENKIKNIIHQENYKYD